MADNFLLSLWSIYKPNHPVQLQQIGANISKLQAFSPRPCWVKRQIVAGQNQVQTLLTFDVSSADQLDPNLLQGVYIEISGQGVVVDCISIDNFITAADGLGTITRRYASGIPAFVSPTPSCYTISRLDDASGYAHDTVVMDYIGQYAGNVIFYSHITGTSIYKVTAYGTPIAIKGDVVAPC